LPNGKTLSRAETVHHAKPSHETTSNAIVPLAREEKEPPM
jgi:hypothetical protein